MFDMCDSTVLTERNSSPAISGFVRRSTTSRAISSSRPVSAPTPSSPAGERFVRVPRERLPEVVAVSGSPYAEVGFALGPVEGEERVITVFSALDNLIKGGAGQAIQSLNLMLGLPEATELDELGPFP